MTKKEQKHIDIIRRLHGLIDSPDIEKKRQSQERWGMILGNTKDINYQELVLENMQAEWVKVNRPHSKEKVILYCHGGGFTAGSAKYARTVTSKLAMATSMGVFVFDYRLAPEHPYPAALEDAMEAWNYLMLQGYGAKDVIVAGDSAGGNMALALVLKLKEEKRMLPKGVVLFSPWTDLTCSGASLEERGAMDPVLTLEYLHGMREAYAKGQCFEEPYLSPLFGDLKGFPPTYIQVGENEILYSDAERLYEKLCTEKVMARIEKFDKMWHVFQMSPVKTSQEAVNKCAEFIFGL